MTDDIYPEADQQMLTRLYNLISTHAQPAATLEVAIDSSLAYWLLAYRKALHRPVFLAWAEHERLDLQQLKVAGGALHAPTPSNQARTFTLDDDSGWRELAPPILTTAQLLDPDEQGLPWLPAPDATSTVPMNWQQVLRFYGYPLPRTPTERTVVLDALAQARPQNELARALTALKRDLEQLVTALLDLMPLPDNATEQFDGAALHGTFVRPDAASFMTQDMNAAATLLDELTNSAAFKALAETQDSQAGEWAFDPTSRTLSGMKSDGSSIRIEIANLLTPTWEPLLRELIATAEHLGTVVRQSRTFSLAQLLSRHGLSVPQTASAARSLIEQLRNTPALTPPITGQLTRSALASRALIEQLAADNDRYQIANALARLSHGHADTAPVALDNNRLTPDPDSVLSGEQSLSHLLTHYACPIPSTAGQAQALIPSLLQPIPASPRLADYRGAFTLAEGFNSEQRNSVQRVVQRFMPQPNRGLLSHLIGNRLAGKTWAYIDAHADYLLERLLATPTARRLGDQLISALQWHGHAEGEQASDIGRDELLLAALILDLDPEIGTQPYAVAGAQLAHAAQWGRSLGAIREDLELHLIRSTGVDADCVTLAAHLLLAGSAAEFLVPGVPATLGFMTNHGWRLFKQGVLMAEALAPGSSRRMTFGTLIDFAGQATNEPTHQRLQGECALSAMLDHAVALGLLEARSDHRYTAAQIQQVEQLLDHQLSHLQSASDALHQAMPERRQIAFDDLATLIPSPSLREKKCLQQTVFSVSPGTLTPSNRKLHASPVELQMQGLLQQLPAQWISTDPELDLAQLRPRLHQLPDTNARFNLALASWLNRLKGAGETAVNYLLSRLPSADRRRLQEGDVRLLVLRRPARQSEALEDSSSKQARTGKFGILVQCTWHQQMHYYEVFPLRMEIYPRPDIHQPLQIGGESLSVSTGLPHAAHPTTTLHLGTQLPFDWQAYALGDKPRPNQHETLVVDLLQTFTGSPASPPMAYGSTRLSTMARSIIHDHLFLDEAAMLAHARGITGLEPEHQFAHILREFFKRLVPFWSCGEDLLSGQPRRISEGAYGCLLDAFGLYFPARGFARKLTAALAAYTSRPVKLFSVLRAGAVLFHHLLNPFTPLTDLWRLGRYGVIRANAWLAQTPAYTVFKLARRADVASGIVLHGDDLIQLLALRHKHRWYAFDPFRARPYGPPLRRFRQQGAVVLSRLNLAADYQPWVTETLFEKPTLIIRRPDGIDLLADGRLYRLDAQTQTFDDVTSPAFYRVTEEFEQLCPPGRSERSPIQKICFAKKINHLPLAPQIRRVEALFHLRITPARALRWLRPRLVYNRQRYEVIATEIDFELTVIPEPAPLVYRETVNGRFISNEQQFGFPLNNEDVWLNHQTRVVELSGLVEGVEDTRVMRAMLLELPNPGAAPVHTLVVEADMGVFYEAAPPPFRLRQNLVFQRLDFDQGGIPQQRVQTFIQLRNAYVNEIGQVPYNPLLPLPSMDVLYNQMLGQGHNPVVVTRLRQMVNDLSPLKQRELLANACEAGRRMHMEVVMTPVEIVMWQVRPPSTHRLGELHRFHAQNAKTHVQSLIPVTGVGPYHRVGLSSDEVIRQEMVKPLVIWQYVQGRVRKITEVILRTGVGNSDIMAHVAHKLINYNNTSAQIWTVNGAHSFVVVGQMPLALTRTTDFSEAGWQDIWICDPWLGIDCPAQHYLRERTVMMIAWDLDNKAIYCNSAGVWAWRRTNDPAWQALLQGPLEFKMN